MNNIIYTPTGRTIKEEAVVRAVAWFKGHEKDIGDSYDGSDVARLAINIYLELLEEAANAGK